MMKILLLLIPALLAGCSSHHARQRYEMATVTSVQPIYRTIEVHRPKQVCQERQVVRREPQSAAPAIVGAIVGGLIGNTVTRGSSHRNVGTAAGAVIGGAIGAESAAQQGKDVMHHETNCYQSGSDIEYQSVIEAYQVTYELDGRTYSARMDRDPGARMPVHVSKPRQ